MLPEQQRQLARYLAMHCIHFIWFSCPRHRWMGSTSRWWCWS